MTGLGKEDLPQDEFDLEVELALSDEDSLPWLESDEYDDQPGGLDAARVVGFAAILLVLIGFGVGGAWWFSNRSAQPEYVADGSTIAAPPGPYKERPADPGGKEFSGTGNLAPAVGEGETREGVLRKDAPKPSIATVPASPTPTASASPVRSAATPAASETPAAPGGVAVQVGAYRNQAQAEAGWVTLQRQTTALSGVKRRVVKGEADIGTVYRLQALPGDLAAARALCQALKDDGIACQVKR